MEYMDAGALDSLLAKHVKRTGKGVPEKVISAVGHSALHGLRFLRERLKVMHRDIKPANMLVNLNGVFKVHPRAPTHLSATRHLLTSRQCLGDAHRGRSATAPSSGIYSCVW